VRGRARHSDKIHPVSARAADNLPHLILVDTSGNLPG